MKLKKSITLTLSFYVFSLLSIPVFAAAEIDALLFQRIQSTSEAMSKYGKNKTNVELPKNIMEWNDAANEQKIRSISVSSGLNAVEQSLNNKSGYRVIWANTWTQSLSTQRGSLTLLRTDESEIKGDKSIVESYLSFSKGAFPEIQAVVLLQPESFRFSENETPTVEPTSNGELFSSTPENINMESIEWNLRVAPQVEDNSVLVLSETRRMKLNTWYYLDHPVLGMMIRIREK